MIHRFLSCFTVEGKSFVPLTSGAAGRFRKIEMLHEAQKMLMQLLNCYTLTGFSAIWKDAIRGTRFPSVASYYWNIQEANEMACTCHGTRGQRPCEKCLVSLNDIHHLRNFQMRTVTEPSEVQNRVKDIFPWHKSL